MIEQPIRIGISGSYGGLNLGDEAILHSMIAQIRRDIPAHITVFSRNAPDTARRHAVDQVVPVRELSRSEVASVLRELDLFVLGGGGILYDSDARTYLREVEIAHELGTPVMLYAIGAGPLENAAVQAHVRSCLEKVGVITVRDRRTRHILEEAGVRNVIEVTADPALLLEPRPLDAEVLRREGLDGTRALVGVSVREPGVAAPDLNQKVYHELLANTADYMVDRYDADVVLIPMERDKLDVQQSHALVSRMLHANRAHVLRGEYGAGELLTLVRHLAFAVGMRLHFLIFAALQRVPFVALPYAPKVDGLVSELGLETPPIKKVSIGRLIAHIDRAWDQRYSLRDKIERGVPVLQRRARTSHARLLELVRQQQLGRTAP